MKFDIKTDKEKLVKVNFEMFKGFVETESLNQNDINDLFAYAVELDKLDKAKFLVLDRGANINYSNVISVAIGGNYSYEMSMFLAKMGATHYIDDIFTVVEHFRNSFIEEWKDHFKVDLDDLKDHINYNIDKDDNYKAYLGNRKFKDLSTLPKDIKMRLMTDSL